MWQTYFQPTTLDETLALLAEHAGRARMSPAALMCWSSCSVASSRPIR